MKGISSEWSFTSHDVIQHKKGYKITLDDGSWSTPLNLKLEGFGDFKGPIITAHMRKGLEYAKKNFDHWKDKKATIPLTFEMLEGETPTTKTPAITYKKRRRISA
jgi:hypothetical protein